VCSITSSSTRSELVAAYRDNADYDTADDLAKASCFMLAARMMLATPVRRTTVGSRGGEEVVHRSPQEIMDEISELDRESAQVLQTIRGLL